MSSCPEKYACLFVVTKIQHLNILYNLINLYNLIKSQLSVPKHPHLVLKNMLVSPVVKVWHCHHDGTSSSLSWIPACLQPRGAGDRFCIAGQSARRENPWKEKWRLKSQLDHLIISEKRLIGSPYDLSVTVLDPLKLATLRFPLRSWGRSM